MQAARQYARILLVVAGLMANVALAQNYPAKPIHIHTGVAGGGADVLLRLVAPDMLAALGQPTVIENISAATLATGVASAPPDGYTLIFWGGALWLSPLTQEANYDPVRDFAPISPLMHSTNILVVHPSLPVQSVKELVALAKAQPGKLNYASGTTGTASHLAGEFLKYFGNIDFALVKYKGGAPQSTTDLLSGVTQLTIGPVTSMSPQIKAGKLRALATTGERRSALYPDLPTVSETLPDYVWETQFGGFAPAKTPEAIIRRLNEAVRQVLAKQDTRDKLLKAGYEASPGTPQELAGIVKSDMSRLGKIIKAATAE